MRCNHIGLPQSPSKKVDSVVLVNMEGASGQVLGGLGRWFDSNSQLTGDFFKVPEF